MFTSRGVAFICLNIISIGLINCVEPSGLYVGSIRETGQTIKGDVFVVDKNTILINNLSGLSQGLYAYAGTLDENGDYTAIGYPLENMYNQVEELDARSQKTIVKFPKETSLYDIDWIGVLNKKQKKMFGRVLITDQVKMKIPRPQKLGPLLGEGEAVSTDVILVDTKTIYLKDFTLNTRASETFFVVGTGPRPSLSSGVRLPDETGSTLPLGRYRKRSLMLSLPEGLDLSNLDWFAVYSGAEQRTLAKVEIPRLLNLPPSLKTAEDRIDIQPIQDSMNCEVLADSLDLQLRWSLGRDDITLQISGNVGNDMYLAFGVKSDQQTTKTKGDVVVGWINANTNQGGVDDYFLSGEVTCSDGAESCPDSTKQDGSRNVQLVTSLSKQNYTMITFKRPVVSSDPYDVDVLINRQQEVFWSIGYKKAEMRQRNKPIKNKGPVYLDFGRPVQCNCPSSKDVEVSNVPTAPPTSERRLPTAPPTSDRRFQQAETSNYNSISLGKYAQLKTTTSKPEPALNPALEALKQKFPKRADGQKTTLELIPELGKFVEPFFPKGPPPGYRPPPGPRPPGAPPNPATHPPPPADENWVIPSIGCNSTEDNVFHIQIGPATSKKGNQGLGKYGQAWYVNGHLAPDLYLVKGQEYTFLVEGGLGTDLDGTFHPFYLTSDSEGGYATKSDYEANLEEVYGGLRHDREGLPVPSIMGRLCIWKSKRPPQTFADYKDFQSQLELACQSNGKPSVLRYKPEFDSPPSIYYQSFSEKYLGGKIHLLDQCHEIQKIGSIPKKIEKKQKQTEKQTQSYYSDYSGNKKAELDQNKNIPYRPSIPSTSKPSRTPGIPGMPVYNTGMPVFNTGGSVKSKQKCKQSRKISGDVMPQFEHFPSMDLDIMKEGSERECDEEIKQWNNKNYDRRKFGFDSSRNIASTTTTRKPLVFTSNLKRKGGMDSFNKYEDTRGSSESYHSNKNNPPRLSDESKYSTNIRQEDANNNPSAQNDNSNSWNQGDINGQPFHPFTAPESAPGGADSSYFGSGNRYPSNGNGYSSNGNGYSNNGQSQGSGDNDFGFFGGGGNPFSGGSGGGGGNRRLQFDDFNGSGGDLSSQLPDPLPPPDHFPDFFHPNEETNVKIPSPVPPVTSRPTPVPVYSPPPMPPKVNPVNGVRNRPKPPSDSYPKYETVNSYPKYERPLASLVENYPPPAPGQNPNRPLRIEQEIFTQTNRPSDKDKVRIFPLGGDGRPRPVKPVRPFPRYPGQGGPPRRIDSPLMLPRSSTPNFSPPPALPHPKHFPNFRKGAKPRKRKKGMRRKTGAMQRKSSGSKYTDKRNPNYDPIHSFYRDQAPSPSSRDEATSINQFIGHSKGDEKDDMKGNRFQEGFGDSSNGGFQVVPAPAAGPGGFHNIPAVTSSSSSSGFQDIGLVSESGFRPIVPQHHSAPTLAFSIHEDQAYHGTMGTIEGREALIDRMDLDYFQEEDMEVGDRGNLVVDIPTAVLPYVPKLYTEKDDAPEEYEYYDYDYEIDYEENYQQYQNIDQDYDVAIYSEELPNRQPDLYSAGSFATNLEVEAPSNTITSIQDKISHPSDELNKESKNSADFDSFETVYNPDAEIKIKNIHEVKIPQGMADNEPLLLSVGSSLSYGGNGGSTKQKPMQKDKSVSSGRRTSTTLENVEGGDDVVYGQVSKTPSKPLDLLKDMDSQLSQKLELLQQQQHQQHQQQQQQQQHRQQPKQQHKTKVNSLVKDLWSEIQAAQNN